MTTEAEHMQWCKDRALAYVERGDLTNALASMASDIRKHPGTDNGANATLLAMLGVQAVVNNDTAGMRRLIEGFR